MFSGSPVPNTATSMAGSVSQRANSVATTSATRCTRTVSPWCARRVTHLIRRTTIAKVTSNKSPSIKVQSPDGREGEKPAEGLVGDGKSKYGPRYVRGLLRAPVCARFDAFRGMAAVTAPPSDPEVAAEQAYLDGALTSLKAMRVRAEHLLADLIAAGNPDLDYVAALSKRVGLLADSPRPLLFGRIDEEDGPTWHIGRRHVEDT